MLVTVQWRNIPRAAPVDVFMSLQLWKNRAIRPELLVLKLEWKGIAFFFFFNSSERSHLWRSPFKNSLAVLGHAVCEKQCCFLWKQFWRNRTPCFHRKIKKIKIKKYKSLCWKVWLCWTKHKIYYSGINCLHCLCSHTLHLLFPLGI